jgi:hypothetical protein
MPYPILISAIIPLSACVRPYTPPACHIQSQYQPLFLSSLVSDPTHPLHAISDPNISHCSSPRLDQSILTPCMPYPIPTSVIAHLLARTSPYAPTACHIPYQYQPLLVSLLVSDPTTHPLHAISHPNISHCSSPRLYHTLRTDFMPYPIPISAIALLLVRIIPYAPPACHIPSQYQPLLVSSLVSNPTHKLHAISHPNISHCSSLRSCQTLRTSCMPYPILISAIARLPLVSDPTHQLHTISDRTVSHYSSPRWR